MKEAFEHSKMLSTFNGQSFPDFDLPGALRVDASDVAIGAVLPRTYGSSRYHSTRAYSIRKSEILGNSI